LKAAFTVWNKRVAPVFDTAGEVLIVDVEEGDISAEYKVSLPVDNLAEKITLLKSTGAEVLICGAVSREAEEQVVAQGIQVFSFVSGEINEVIQAWLNNDLGKGPFIMPGCFGRRQRARCCRKNFQKGTGGGRRRVNIGP
jgi:predicted Fe-Mo cluster-binding NifX family protein